MQKHISLLYKDSAPETETVSEIKEAIYNLNIDRMAEGACKNKKCTDYFLSVLARPATSTENIAYRAEILRDFIRYPDLLSSLVQLFKSYNNLSFETEEMTKEIFRYGMPASVSGLMDCTYEELYINAHYARNVIAYFSEIYELFAGYDVKSAGLLAIKDFCVQCNESKCISAVENAAELFRSENPESYRFAVKTEFDAAMSAIRCTLADIEDVTAKEKKNILSIFKKKDAIPSVWDIGSSAADSAATAVTYAIGDLSMLFSDIANGIYSVCYGLSEELQFYYTAIEIEKRIRALGMKYCFPQVFEKEADCLEACGIYDMLLFNEGKRYESIVTNDVALTRKGIIAMGDNNCGKTSFLRAVGSAILFAQNGLFVCADSMNVSVRSGIFSHFSSEEKDFTDSSDAAGRFEGEVIDIARIVNALTPYSLVLLNETFQTTAYREGALGMKEILDVFPEIKVKYIFVTHMKAIFPLFEEGEVTVLKADKYKLIEQQ
ncbi:MAG: hypothetical protein E7634_03350 [Ruminococcaceae bacterium]|nr:hypothetical protein [Oscillospiraceae bacterium]